MRKINDLQVGHEHEIPIFYTIFGSNGWLRAPNQPTVHPQFPEGVVMSLDKTPYGRYRQHRGTAKSRGIPFLFSFQDWVAWWNHHLGPDWMSKRGSGKGQYVMGRYNDTGPYMPGNVKCITNAENTAEERARFLKELEEAK